MLGQRKIFRKKVDVTETRLKDYIDLLNDTPELAYTFETVYRKLAEGKIIFEGFRHYMLEELRDIRRRNPRHYKLRHDPASFFSIGLEGNENIDKIQQNE